MIQKKKKIIVHIGLHKTATTSLQRSVFPALKKTFFLGKGEEHPSKISPLLKNIFEFCFAKTEDKSRIPLIRNEINELNKDVVLISSEWFTSDFSFQYLFDGCKWQDKLRRIRKLFEPFDIEILLTLRQPLDCMFSHYCEHITINEHKKYNFYKVYPTFKDFFFNSNDSKIYFYESFLEFLNSLFNTVHILKFENILNGSYKNLLHHIFDEEVKAISHDNKKIKINNTVIVKRKNLFLRYLLHLSPNFIRNVILKYLLNVKSFVYLRKMFLSFFSEKIAVQKLDSKMKDYYSDLLRDSISKYKAL